MTHFVDALQLEAEDAILRMRQAALDARRIHARAELMRHVLSTARKVKDRPPAEAVETVVREWMAAWQLDRDAWPHVARDMEAFTAAFHDYARTPDAAADARLRACAAALDAALAREGTSIADQMAFRSQCAHGWWAAVVPPPEPLPDSVPRPAPDRPFWEAGCAPRCR